MELIRRLADPTTLSVSDKISGGLLVAVVGMAITFLALIFLWLMIEVMARVLKEKAPKKKEEVAVVPQSTAPVVETATNEMSDDDEIVAVIMASLAASMNTSINNIVVNKIVRVPDARPMWAKVGLVNQMNDRV